MELGISIGLISVLTFQMVGILPISLRSNTMLDANTALLKLLKILQNKIVRISSTTENQTNEDP